MTNTESQEDILKTLRKFVHENFLFEGREEDVDVDASLVLGGMIDSTGFMELIVFIEKEWALKIPLREMTPEYFGTIRKIAAYLSNAIPQRLK